MISSRIKRLRKDIKMTQEILAKNTGFSRSVIAKIESGGTQPTMIQIDTIACFFDVSTDYLIRGDEASLNDDEREIIDTLRDDEKLYKMLLNLIKQRKTIENLSI